MSTVLLVTGLLLAVLTGAGWGLAGAFYSTLRRQDREVADLRGRLSAFHPLNVRQLQGPPTATWFDDDPDGGGHQYLMDARGTGLLVEKAE